MFEGIYRSVMSGRRYQIVEHNPFVGREGECGIVFLSDDEPLTVHPVSAQTVRDMVDSRLWEKEGQE